MSFAEDVCWVKTTSSFFCGGQGVQLGWSSQDLQVDSNHGSACSPPKWPYKWGWPYLQVLGCSSKYLPWYHSKTHPSHPSFQSVQIQGSFIDSSWGSSHKNSDKSDQKYQQQKKPLRYVSRHEESLELPSSFFPVPKKERYLNFEGCSSWRYTCSTEPWCCGRSRVNLEVKFGCFFTTPLNNTRSTSIDTFWGSVFGAQNHT